jgi:hypothetical protein
MTKKLLLTFALLLTAVTGAWADDSGSCGEVSYSYVESTHTLTISGTGAMADYASSSERPWDSYVEDIETIIIENGVTSIGNRAFEKCTGLTTVTIPAGVTRIGSGAFEGCSGLTTVTIPASVTYIGSDAFYLCMKVEVVYCNANPEELTWDESGCDDFKPDGTTIINVADADPWIEKFTGKVHGTFSDTPYVPLTWNYDAGTKTLTFSGTAAIPSYNDPDERPWKDYVSEVEKIVISDGVTSIGDKAFRGCSGLTTVTIGSGVTYIGSDAFHDCTKVEVVYCNANPATLTWDENGCDDFKSDGSTIIHVADPAPWIAKFTGKVNGIFSDKPYVPFTWNYDAGTKTLTFSGTVIPSYNDPDDRPWKDYVSEVENIVIEDGVTIIGNRAFEKCTGLTTVTIPAGVTRIGNYAFRSCTGLTSVTIPSSVTSIGKYAFYDCPSLTSVTIPDGVTSIGDDVFEGCKNLTSVTIPSSVTSIGNFAFYECTSLTSVTIPSSVTSIGYLAFKYCESLTSVIVNAPNCTLVVDAFDECSELEAIYVPSDKVEYYKAAENWSAYADKITAFIGGDCGAEGHETDVTWLLKGTSPNYTLTISGTGAMADYASSENQPWKDYRSSITSVIIGSGVTSIGENAFNNCTGLASVTVDAPDCTLGNGALEGCSELGAIYVPSDLVDHYKTAWSAYASIIMEKIISQGDCGAEGHETDVTWVLKGTSPNYILTISGTGAMADYDSGGQPWYSYAEGIETVVIESGVTSIGNYAFLNCYGLTSVTIPSSVTNIGKKAFLSCKNLPTVTIPASVTSIGDGAFLSCSNLATMTVEAGNKVYDSRNSCNAIIEKETNTLIAGCKGSTIPGDVTSIGNYAFRSCTGLTSVTIPASVTSIGEKAFYYCDGLTTLTIPAGVTYIGPDVFYRCTEITDVYCNADPTKLTWDEVGCDDFKEDGSTIIHVADADPWYAKFGGVVNGIFRDPSTIPLTWKYDSETKTLTFTGTEAIPSYTYSSDRPWYDYVEEVENIVIEEGVRGIGNYAFYNCTGLTSVTIPASVTSIGEKAFYNCYGLTSVTIPASVTRIGTEAFKYCYGLTSVTIPASVTSIGDGAFYYCYGLTTLTIGSGVTYIGYDAFYGCENVADVYCYADPDALTWDEGGCDDFKSDGSTICHVTDATKFKEKWSTGDPEVDVNVDFVGDLAPEAVTNPAGEEYWSSYYNSAAHLKADDNTTVYKATLSGTTVTLTEITDKVITAGQAVLLKKTTTDAVELTPCAAASTDDYSGNDLEGVDVETAKESGSDYYVLSYQASKLSFYKYSGATLGANKAFFKIPANSSREFLDILGETTSIEGLKNGRIEELKFYDLNGRRVENPTKGIYIVNGKKVVIKN